MYLVSDCKKQKLCVCADNVTVCTSYGMDTHTTTVASVPRLPLPIIIIGRVNANAHAIKLWYMSVNNDEKHDPMKFEPDLN